MDTALEKLLQLIQKECRYRELQPACRRAWWNIWRIIFTALLLPDWNNCNNQAYSRLRDWNLSASWRPNKGPPQRHGSMVSRGSFGAPIWAPMMPRGKSLTESKCKVFQAGLLAISDGLPKFLPEYPNINPLADWKLCHRNTTPIEMMEDNWRPPFKPLGTILRQCTGSYRRHYLVPMMPTGTSLFYTHYHAKISVRTGL